MAIAIGMLTVSLRLKPEDALAVLRAHAYSTGRTIDDVADDVANRQLPAGELQIDSDT